VWCGLLGNKLTGPFVLDNNLTGNTYEFFLRNELPGLLENVPVMVRGQIYFQHDWAPPPFSPHYIRHVKEYLHESSSNHWLDHSGPLFRRVPNDGRFISWKKCISLKRQHGIKLCQKRVYWPIHMIFLKNFWFSARERYFSLLTYVQTGSGSHLAFSEGNQGFLTWG
jgi:hypothetical protein